MKDVRGLLRQLEGCVQEEIGAQGRAADTLQPTLVAVRTATSVNPNRRLPITAPQSSSEAM